MAGVAGAAAAEKAARLSEHTSAGHEQPIAESLAMLTTIDGFFGAAVFDANAGSLLGTEGGDAALDLGVAAAGNAEVLGAVLATINDLRLDDSIADVVITIRRQCHLIRPSSQRAGVFVYLILDRAQSNLALARLRLAEAERSITALGLKDAIEDILITLGKQYHLIRPLAQKDGLFIYLVLDKARSNLAMACFALSEVEQSIAI